MHWPLVCKLILIRVRDLGVEPWLRPGGPRSEGAGGVGAQVTGRQVYQPRGITYF